MIITEDAGSVASGAQVQVRLLSPIRLLPHRCTRVLNLVQSVKCRVIILRHLGFTMNIFRLDIQIMNSSIRIDSFLAGTLTLQLWFDLFFSFLPLGA